VQFYGNFAREDLLLSLAAQIERAHPAWFAGRPPVHVTSAS
jgi:Asp-tRNA(Asn)/Glu-tRNA(Gln) amidotransferase A subunit family amidase